MNKKQLTLISQNLGLNADLTKAVQLIIIDGLSGYAAEKVVYGKVTTTTKRAEKKVREILAFCQAVSKAKN